MGIVNAALPAVALLEAVTHGSSPRSTQAASRSSASVLGAAQRQQVLCASLCALPAPIALALQKEWEVAHGTEGKKEGWKMICGEGTGVFSLSISAVQTSTTAERGMSCLPPK